MVKRTEHLKQGECIKVQFGCEGNWVTGTLIEFGVHHPEANLKYPWYRLVVQTDDGRKIEMYGTSYESVEVL